ncbi:MAG: hypothetical protein U1D55_05020 [Phycisphaerae bacterium]
MRPAIPTTHLDGDCVANLVANSLRALDDEARRIIEFSREAGVTGARLRDAADELNRLASEPPGSRGVGEIRARLQLLASGAKPPSQPCDVERPSGIEQAPAVELSPGHLASESSAALAFWRQLARFALDLSYVQIVQSGGVAALNARLDGLLGALRGVSPDALEAGVIAGQINDTLRRAIYVFPHLATGVALLLTDGSLDEAAAEEFISRKQANRHELSTLWRAAGEPRVDGRLCVHLPLPYFFSRRTPQRGAMRCGRRGKTWRSWPVAACSGNSCWAHARRTPGNPDSRRRWC